MPHTEQQRAHRDIDFILRHIAHFQTIAQWHFFDRGTVVQFFDRSTAAHKSVVKVLFAVLVVDVGMHV